LEDLGVGGRVIRKLIVRKSVGRVWFGLIWLRIRACGELCEHGNELSDSIKYVEFRDDLRNCQLLKKVLQRGVS
jgi:hypothetical protein